MTTPFEQLNPLGITGLVIKAENDWQDGRPQVAVQRQLTPFFYSSIDVPYAVFCCSRF